MPSFLDANNLQPFINEDVRQWTELVQYQGLNGTQKTGYNATERTFFSISPSASKPLKTPLESTQV